MGLIKHPDIRAQAGCGHCTSSFLERRSNAGEGRDTACGFRPAPRLGTGRRLLRFPDRVFPGRKDGSSGPRSPTCPRLCPCDSRGTSPAAAGGLRKPRACPRERASRFPQARRGADSPPFGQQEGYFFYYCYSFSPRSVHVVAKSVAPPNGRRRRGRSARPARGERGGAGSAMGARGAPA